MTDVKDTTGAAMARSDKSEPERSPQDRAAVDRLRERRKRKKAPRFEVAYEGDTANITAADGNSIYEHAQLADLFDTADTAFSSGMLGQIANIARSGKQLTSRELNFVLATVRALDPRDATEVLLTVQMAAIHNATIVAARRLTHCETIAQQDSNSNMLNKLARTFAAQIEALKRYRSTGEQNVRVTHQHVNVTAGQAVVGISQGEGEPMKSRANPMHLVELMNAARRCSARSKRSGCRCRAPAMKGRSVCRMHGARAGAPMGKANGAWRHGMATNEAIAVRREMAQLVREAGKQLAAMQAAPRS